MNLNKFLLLDLETVGAPDAEQWLGEITAPKNYTKAESIEAYVKDERANLLARAGLDPDLCRIVAVGWQVETVEPRAELVMDDVMERIALEEVWAMVSASRPMVGYGLTWFDAGVLVRRSQLLGVAVPAAIYQQGKYRHPLIVELADYLTLNGMIEQKKGRGLDYHCQRLGIMVEDVCSGKDVGQLWKDGQIEAIRQHCRADIERIRQLAIRLRVITPTPVRDEELMPRGDAVAPF